MNRTRNPAADAVAALIYILAVTGGAGALADWLGPRMKIVAGDEEFPCADHGCACKTAEQCRTNCCCFGGPRPAPAPRACHAAPPPPVCPHHAAKPIKPVPLTAIAEQECSGGGPKASGASRIGFHVAAITACMEPSPAGSSWPAQCGDLASPRAFARLPFKVPLTAPAVRHALS